VIRNITLHLQFLVFFFLLQKPDYQPIMTEPSNQIEPVAALAAQVQQLATMVFALQERIAQQPEQERIIEMQPEPPNSEELASAPTPEPSTPQPANIQNGSDSRLSTKHPDPETYFGDKEKLEPFIAQLGLKLIVNHDRYPTEPQRVAYAISRLGGNALIQVTPFINGRTLDRLPTLETIIEILRRAFGVSDRHAEAVRRLRSLRQKNREFIVYYAEFERCMADCDYSDQAKVDWLLAGLNQELLNALSNQSRIPTDFAELVELLTRIDSAQRYLTGIKAANQPLRTPISDRVPRSQPASTTTSAPAAPVISAGGDPMDLDATRQRERERRRLLALCFYCGEPGHKAHDCPRKKAPGPRLRVHMQEQAPPELMPKN
jgi:Retrotransposon gag protein/Zinc knuckle